MESSLVFFFLYAFGTHAHTDTHTHTYPHGYLYPPPHPTQNPKKNRLFPCKNLDLVPDDTVRYLPNFCPPARPPLTANNSLATTTQVKKGDIIKKRKTKKGTNENEYGRRQDKVNGEEKENSKTVCHAMQCQVNRQSSTP
jgi:hypothetical protein